jgi:N,N-dimethylformamidase beta subunit-like, C-terminal
MTTATAHIKLLAVAAVLLVAATGSTRPLVDEELFEGRAPTAEELRPSVEAAFQGESVKPGTVASLVLFNRARGLTLQIFHTGPEHPPTVGNSEMQGVPVTGARAIGKGAPGRVVHVRIGNWASGVYFARLTAADGRVGFAPVVIAPRRLGEHRVAVVEPTLTWQAYNLRDDNGDGKGDSWYARWTVHTVRLDRPYLDRGVPYHFRGYDLPFLHWLAWTGRQADYLSDADLDAISDSHALARAYDLIVFPGHHEYVTTHEYGVVRSYRDQGGNLAYLSANNFFWQVIRRGRTIERTSQWRDLDVPEAALIGTQYRANDDGEHRGPWVVRDLEAAPWLFAGTGLADGSTFGNGGIEIDETTAGSPKGVHVIAEIPDLLGPGLTAQMTYYETAAGAKVFAAGAFTLAGQAGRDPVVTQLLANLWDRLSQP